MHATKPNNTLGTSWNDQFIELLGWVRVFSCWISTCQDQKQVSVTKDFGLLGVWFTEFTLYQPFSWALKEKVALLWNPGCQCLHQWIVIQKCSYWKSIWQGLCK